MGLVLNAWFVETSLGTLSSLIECIKLLSLSLSDYVSSVPITGYCMTNDLMPSIIQSQMKMLLTISRLSRTQWTWLPCYSMLIMASILHVLHSCRTLILLFPMQRYVSCGLFLEWVQSNVHSCDVTVENDWLFEVSWFCKRVP